MKRGNGRTMRFRRDIPAEDESSASLVFRPGTSSNNMAENWRSLQLDQSSGCWMQC